MPLFACMQIMKEDERTGKPVLPLFIDAVEAQQATTMAQEVRARVRVSVRSGSGQGQGQGQVRVRVTSGSGSRQCQRQSAPPPTHIHTQTTTTATSSTAIDLGCPGRGWGGETRGGRPNTFGCGQALDTGRAWSAGAAVCGTAIIDRVHPAIPRINLRIFKIGSYDLTREVPACCWTGTLDHDGGGVWGGGGGGGGRLPFAPPGCELPSRQAGPEIAA